MSYDLTVEELDAIKNSERCTRCGHLEIFHSFYDDGDVACDIPNCKCQNFTTREGVKQV